MNIPLFILGFIIGYMLYGALRKLRKNEKSPWPTAINPCPFEGRHGEKRTKRYGSKSVALLTFAPDRNGAPTKP